jgi:hypothetical protein
MHRALRYLAVEDDTSVPKLLKRVISEYIAIRYSAPQQPVQGDLQEQEFIPVEMSNGEEM